MPNSFKDVKYGKDQEYRIWLHVIGVERLQRDDPRGVNYKTALISSADSIETIDSGYLTMVDYYGDQDDPESLFLKVSVVYDAATRSRTTTRSYMTSTGEAGDYKKISRKRYNSRQWARVEVRRRDNIVKELVARVGAFGVLPYVQEMLNSLDNELNGYIDTYDTRLIQGIINYDDSANGSWLATDVSAILGVPAGTTLRMVIVGALDYDGLVIGQS